ncbi:thioredoxin-like protein [Coniophora puteana RWD-64-598 SS2]|uniref:Thioredoxin-like protein n=1 Tax=Coniophora puteana (strain RWD-64-598) TaxID=741705 RepID=A0A5M3M6R4_CONPW|nr:thioredoxin-like protein [Coniophora puteana RWD-64-598 SS2]EIW74797.1 thioredoxin-like protein [Coniophora puteana RWD-64-598 SS2]
MSSSNKQITLYYSKLSVYVQRASMVLEEAKVNYKKYPIQIFAPKPDWFLEKINPRGLVPAITYGGPDVPGDQPSSEATVIIETPVIMEFIADLHPEANLLPKDPVERAKVRLFVDAVNTHFASTFVGFIVKGDSYQTVIDGARAVQKLLPDHGKWAIGNQFTIADIALAPFISRIELASKRGVGKYAAGENKLVLDALNSPEFAKLKAYSANLQERPSFKATFDGDYIIGELTKLLA